MVSQKKLLKRDVNTLRRLLEGRLFSQFYVYKEIINAKTPLEFKAAMNRYVNLEESINKLTMRLTRKENELKLQTKGK
ncbi:hypothetical protein PQC36_gp102 [Proteus phage Vb_PmiP-P59]|uniref:Uncharacterized protein n=3 Tax=Privateervirus TaxID=2843440 RepID=A0A7L7SH23_9CAUD|nr:hypothetical protein HWD17_gp087 [Proteus phage Privateer]YP_010672229.1 hypothetical protein PQC36_gp102 [Proteus phage Vb_PmiP-P59]YP_010672346.1 hypothetical protein PQC37_gp083 [Proteus phage 3H10_20]QIN94880.1 hypothetical protein CPT_Privateer_087 [Proteus phage Privateer]QMV48272.1 hypothetical protein [Proteus phage Vb_PmiP-P59]QOC54869.1 hypothetical protein [Proteus phage 3H10_20]